MTLENHFSSIREARIKNYNIPTGKVVGIQALSYTNVGNAKWSSCYGKE